MGFRQKLGEIFSGDPKEKPMEQSLESWGLKLIADKKLKERLEALQLFFDELEADIEATDPLKYLEELIARQEKLNRAIHSLAMPFYRAGTLKTFRELMEGWQLWNSLAIYWLEAIQDRIESIREEQKEKGNKDPTLLRITTIDIATLVRRIHSVLQLHVWQDGQVVLAGSYLNADVSASHVAIIKTLSSGYGQRLQLDEMLDKDQ